MSEDRQRVWTDVKKEVGEMSDLLSRNLGKTRKAQNCEFLFSTKNELEV